MLELNPFDTVVFDPPRAGAEAQVRQLARSDVRTVIGVSCNAATFARDAKILMEGGYELETLWPVDQFLYSAHLELVARFSKAKAPKKIKAPRKPRKIVEAASEEDEETQSVDGPTSQYETSNAEVIALELCHQKELKALTASNEKNQAKAIAEAVAEARDEERRVAEKLLGINILWLYLNLFTLHC